MSIPEDATAPNLNDLATGWECRYCGYQIAKHTDECPKCGADPLTKGTCTAIASFGLVMSVTVVLAPIGLPIALIAGIARFGVPKRLAVESDYNDAE